MESFLSDMNWFDITIISVIFISALFALIRGFIKAMFSFATWLGATAIAFFGYIPLYSYLSGKITNEKAVIAISSVGLFLFSFIILAIINSYFISLLKKQTGGALDRTLGLSFGLVRGVFIVCLVFFSMSLTSSILHVGNDSERPGPPWFTEAKTYNLLDIATSAMVSMLPKDIPQKLEATVNEFRQFTMSAISGELGDSTSASRVLDEKQRGTVQKMITSLPQEELGKIYGRYNLGAAAVSEFERMAVFREIFILYKQLSDSGELLPDAPEMDKKDIEELEEALINRGRREEQPAEAEETGYKNHNIRQLERLIGNL